MKKIVISIVSLLVVVFIVCTVLINQVWNQNDSVFKKARATLQTEMMNESILDEEVYNGKQQWVWFRVQSKDGTKSHVLVPTKKEKDQPNMVVRKELDGISQEEAKVIVTQKESPKSISRVVLGVEDERVVWEITYTSSSNKLSYYYLDFISGDFVKSFSL